LLYQDDMGKGGRGGRAKKAAGVTTAATTDDDDELIAQATAANKAAAAAALAKMTREIMLDDGCPSKAELVTALDKITLFDLRSSEDGAARDFCLSPAGECVFYIDHADACEALEARKITHPGPLALGCTGLGRAFGLSEGHAFGFSSPAKFPFRLQGPTEIISAIGEADSKRLCPPSLRKQLNERTGPIPMFSLEELVEGTETAPYFFSHNDLLRYWMENTGKKQEEMPPRLVLTDLLVLIVRMMQVPQDWKTIQLMPMTSSMEWLQAVTANQLAAAEAAKAKDPLPPLPEDEPPPLV